jgi:hypothetical protein
MRAVGGETLAGNVGKRHHVVTEIGFVLDLEQKTSQTSFVRNAKRQRHSV